MSAQKRDRPQSLSSRRTDEAVREAIAAILEEEVADPRVRFVTITGVHVTDDVRHATVWYTSLSPDAVQRDPRRVGGDPVPASADVAAGLERAAARVQSLLARRVRMRNTPTLTFVPDPAVEQGRRIDALLREVVEPESGPETRS